MSMRKSLLVLSALAALAGTALASTGAFAFADGSGHFRASAAHSSYAYSRGVIGGRTYIPGCGHIGCNMKW
jgi:hypothetical protein